MPKTAGQKRYVDAIAANTITFGIGPAGTGKSYLAVALAVQALQAKEVARIILTRPAVEAGERLGFLPGDLMAKVDPYLRPLYDALYDMLEPEGTQRLLERGTIEVAPLAFMRGRTLNGSFVILDEAQNTTPEQMKMFLTRIGFGTKVVVTGDVTQIDIAGGRSGLLGLEAILGGIEGIAFVHLGQSDVVRHRIVRDIVSAYDRSTSSADHRRRAAVSAQVFVADEQSDRAVDLGRWVTLAERVLADRGIGDGTELSVLFVDEAAIAELNERFLGRKGPTDVLSFPIEDDLVGPGHVPDQEASGPGRGAARIRGRAAAPRRRRHLPGGRLEARTRPRRHLRGRARPPARARNPAPARHGPRRRRRGRGDGGARAAIAHGPPPPARSVMLATDRSFTGADGGLLIAVFLLSCVSAVLALAETGLTRTSRARAKSLEDAGHRGARSLRRLVEEPEKFLAPILLLVLLCQLVAATLVGVVASQLFGAIGVAVATVVRGGGDLRVRRGGAEAVGRASCGPSGAAGSAARDDAHPVPADAGRVGRVDRFRPADHARGAPRALRAGHHRVRAAGVRRRRRARTRPSRATSGLSSTRSSSSGTRSSAR